MRKGLVLLIMVLALAATACYPTAHVTGGGFIDGVHDEDAKANFGFNVKCDGTHDGAKGHLTYHDGLLKIKGTVTACKYEKIDRVWTLVVMGDWVPQGKSYHGFEGGTFKIMGSDEGEPGIDDEFFIRLYEEGDGMVYENGGYLLGGNIQEHEVD